MRNMFAASAIFVFVIGLSGQAWASHDDEVVVHEEDADDATLHESAPGMRVDVSEPNYVSYRSEESVYETSYDATECRTESVSCGCDHHCLQEGTMPIEWGVVEW
jgi:hypothetical protein